MNAKLNLSLLGSFVICCGLGGQARGDAGFLAEASPAWTRPADATAAANTLTTYQYWYGDNNAYATPQLSPGATFSPDTSINPNGSASAIDTTADSDGVFYDGHDLYSFSLPLNPQVTIPQYSVAGQQLNVTVQTQTFGSDPADGLSVTYTDANNVQQTISYDLLANHSFATLEQTSSNTEFGPADTTVDEWTFTVPNTSTIQLDWTGWGVSSALQDIAVDTQSVSVPEPGSISLLGLAGILLLKRGRRVVRARNISH